MGIKDPKDYVVNITSFKNAMKRADFSEPDPNNKSEQHKWTLLKEEIGTVLRRVGSGKRMTFGPHEARLTRWMAKNAAVALVETDKPWIVEEHIIESVPLPLNIHKNNRHPFCADLKRLRAEARQRARALPILKSG